MGVIVNEIDAMVSVCKCIRIKKKDGSYEDVCYKAGVVGALDDYEEKALCRNKVYIQIDEDSKVAKKFLEDKKYSKLKYTDDLGMDNELSCRDKGDMVECFFSGKSFKTKDLGIFSVSQDIFWYDKNEFRMFGVDSMILCRGAKGQNGYERVVCVTEEILPLPR